MLPHAVRELTELGLQEERAPDGFDRIDDVLSAEEREGTAAAYKRLAGFDKDALNARPPIVPGAAT